MPSHLGRLRGSVTIGPVPVQAKPQPTCDPPVVRAEVDVPLRQISEGCELELAAREAVALGLAHVARVFLERHRLGIERGSSALPFAGRAARPTRISRQRSESTTAFCAGSTSRWPPLQGRARAGAVAFPGRFHRGKQPRDGLR
jgi:hypothetical protein